MTNGDTKILRDLEDFAGIASDWFWETDSEHRFTYFSARMEEVTGMRSEAILGRRRDHMNAIGYVAKTWDQHLDDLAHHRPFRNFEYKLKRDIGEGFLWLRVAGDPVFDGDGTFMGYRGTGHDITEEKETLTRLAQANKALATRNRELDALRRELELAAFEDPLTGLRNRRAFDTAIADALDTAASRVALLHIDLDRFKRVNDTLGHPAGDMVLVTAAARINAQCGNEGEVFRVGGDEFSLIVPNCADPMSALHLGQSIVDAIAQPITFAEEVFLIGASVGVALSDGVPTSPHRLIARSDAALYAAKAEGRGCVRKCAA